MHSRFFRGLLTLIALTGALTVSAFAAYDGVATVTAEAAALVAEPNTEAEVLTHAVAGDVVLTVEPTEDEAWYKVDYCTIQGYLPAESIDRVTTYTEALCYARVDTDGSSLNLRQAPGTESAKIGSLVYGSLMCLTGFEDGWFQVNVNGKTGYVSADYVLAVQADGSRRDDAVAPVSTLGQQIVDYAKTFIGTPYVYGGSTPSGFDCSGFTSYVYRHFGYELNRASRDQRSNGVAVTRDQLQPGDIICWSGHVALYVGNGQCIHAPRTGTTIRIDDISRACTRSIQGYRRII